MEMFMYYLWSVYVWAIVVKYAYSDILDFYLKLLLVFSDLFIVAWDYDIWEFRGKGEGYDNSLVSSSEYNTVFLSVPFDCCNFDIR